MTNAAKELSSLAKEAGFKKLFAWVRAVNAKSIGVLERAGYEKVGEIENKGMGLSFEYEKQLT